MVTLAHVGTRYAAPGVEDRVLSDVAFASLSGDLALFSITAPGTTISRYRVTATGVQLTDQTFAAPGIGLGVAATLAVATRNGTETLLGFGPNTGGITSFQISGGALGDPTLLGNIQPGAITALADLSLGGTSFHIAAHRGSGALASYRVQGDGSLANPVLTPLAEGQGATIAALQTIETGSGVHVLAVSATGDHLTSYRVNPDGSMTTRAILTADQGFYVAAPHALALARVAGTDFAVIAGANSSSLSVVEVTANGGLIMTDHVIDGRSTRFDHATALAVAQDEDRAFVAATGADDGVSLFQILPDGTLLHLDSFADTLETALSSPSGITAAMTGTQVTLATIAEADDGLTLLEADVGPRGLTRIGSSSAEVLNGTNAHDVLWARGGNDTVSGGAGDDVLIGGYGSDRLTGGGGSDTFVFRAGEAANDTISDFDPLSDRIDLSGLGLVYSLGALDFTPIANGAIIAFRGDRIVVNTVNGASLQLDDFTAEDFFPVTHLTPVQFGSVLTFTGTSQNDILDGTDLEDTLTGLGGHDTLEGGDAADRLNGGSGIDQVSYRTSSGAVVADLANPAANTGEAAGDTYLSIEELHGSAMADRLLGDSADNRLIGHLGQDWLVGRGGHDALIGRDGRDTMIGGTGRDRMDGGSGVDQADYRHAAQAVLADLAFASLNRGEAAGDTYTAVEDLHGSGHHDNLRGTDGANSLWGAAGHDNLVGRGGRDALYGGAGNDTLMGSTGRDHLNGGSGTDRATYFSAESAVRADLLSPTMNTGEALGDTFSGIEDLQGTAFNDTLFGDNNANVLFGNEGRDFLSGRGGTDHLRGIDGGDDLMGGTGADTLDGGAGIDQASYRNAASGLTADLMFAGNNSGDANGDQYQSIENLYGSLFGDSLRGSDTANQLHGGDGNDWLSGRGGRDTLIGGTGNDVLDGGSGRDVLSGGSGIDRADYRNSPLGLVADLRDPANNTRDATGDSFLSIENLYGTAFNDTLTGDAGQNTIWGADGNDRLFGGGGNDVVFGMTGSDLLNGGAANDTLTGGLGADTFVFAAGHDVITDFTLGEDVLRLEATLWNGIDYSVGDVIARFAARAGSSTVMNFGPEDILTVQGVSQPEALLESILII